MEEVRGGIHVHPHPVLSLVGAFESKCGASSLRPTPPVCEITSRGHTNATATTALSPLPANVRLPDGMSRQTLESTSHT
jgi:hypothetical protein